MNCRAARTALLRAADRELPIEERLALDAHVESCPRCGPLARAMRRLDEGFLRLPEPPLERLDLDAEVRAIRARFDRSAETAGRSRPLWPRLAAAAAAAAAAVIVWLALRGADSGTPAPVIAEPAPRAPAPASQARDAAPLLGASDRAGAEDGLSPVDDCDVGTATAEVADDAPVARAVHAPPTPEELARLEAARSDLGAGLFAALETARALPPAGLEQAFARAAEPFERAGWPVLRLAVALANGEDLDRARAALRYVGLFGSRSELAVVQRALARSDLAPDAQLALADLGEPALDLIAERMQDPALAQALVARLADRPPAEAVELCEALARRLAESDPAPRARGPRTGAGAALVRRTATALAAHGAPAVGALLRLATDGVLPAADALALLRTVPGATNALADLLRDGQHEIEPRIGTAVVVATIETLRPVNGVAWLEARARGDRGARDAALRGLASYADGEALEALLRLSLAGPVGRQQAHGLVAQAIDARPEAASELARRLHAARERAAAHELLDLLAARPRPACVPGWIALAASDLLPRSERRSAVEAAGELGAPADVPLFAALFEALPASERELRAVTVIALHRLGGRDAVAEVFPRAQAKARERLLELLADPAARERPTTTSFRVARELDSLESGSTP